jgi:energy-coupling factor transporter transmembrane protein EcfT
LTNSFTLYVPKKFLAPQAAPFQQIDLHLVDRDRSLCGAGGYSFSPVRNAPEFGLGCCERNFCPLLGIVLAHPPAPEHFHAPHSRIAEPQQRDRTSFDWQTLTIYREGLLFGIRTLLQVAAVLSASLLFVYTTHPADLFAALQTTGWSQGIAYVFSSPLLLIPAMRERIEIIHAAQAARGLSSDGNIFQRTRALAPLLVPLVLGAFTEIEERSIALDVRAFNSPGRKTLWRIVPDSRGQRLGRWSMLLLSFVLILLRVDLTHFPFLHP